MATRSVAYDKPMFSAAPAITVVESPSLRRNVSWTLVGNGLYAGCQLVMVMVLAKLGTPEMVGQFTLAFAVAAPVFMLFNLQLRNVQATDAKGEYAFREYFVLRLATTVLAMIVVAGLASVSRYDRETIAIILLVGMAKAVESFSDVLYGPLQQHEQMDRIAKSLIVRGVLALAGLSLGIVLTRRLSWGIVGLLVAWTVTLAAYDLPRARELLRRSARHPGSPVEASPRWNVRRITTLVWVALPLGFVMTLSSLNANIPRYFIERSGGTHDLGIFMAMAYLMVVGTTIMSAFFQSASPRLSRYYAAGDKPAFEALLRRLVLVGAAVGAAGILSAGLFGRQVLTLLYRPEFALRTDVFVWLMIVAALQYVGGVFAVATTSMRIFAAQAPIQVVSTLITVVVLAVCVPRFGLVGAAWALLAEACWSRLAFVLLLRSRLRTLGEVA